METKRRHGFPLRVLLRLVTRYIKYSHGFRYIRSDHFYRWLCLLRYETYSRQLQPLDSKQERNRLLDQDVPKHSLYLISSYPSSATLHALFPSCKWLPVLRKPSHFGVPHQLRCDYTNQ